MSADKDRADEIAAQERVVERMAQEARLMQDLKSLPQSGQLSGEDVEFVRERTRWYIDEHGLDLVEACQEAGVSERTAKAFFEAAQVEWANASDVARRLYRWMERRIRGAKPGMPQGYVPTRIAQRMLGVMHFAKRDRVIGLICGPAGVSKSIVCRAASEQGLVRGAIHVECLQTTRAPGQFLRLLARRVGVSPNGALADVEMRVIERLRGLDALLLIDEAHYLSRPALNIVRDVHKQANVGVVLLGTIDIEQAVDDATAFYGQFASCVAYRYDILEQQIDGGDPLYSPEEIAQLAANMELKLASDATEYLQMLACEPGWGGLRAVATLLLKAELLRDNDDKAGQRITRKHCILADRGSHTRRHVERLRQRLELQAGARKANVA